MYKINCIKIFLKISDHKNYSNYSIIRTGITSVARPGPTRVFVLPSTFQALASPAQQELHDSTTN